LGRRPITVNPIWSIAVPALSGLLAGILGSLVAPWVNWRIEKRREQLCHRRKTIESCRNQIASPNFAPKAFPGCPEWNLLRPFLTEKERDCFEQANKHMVVAMSHDTTMAYRKALNRAVVALEAKWGLA
jgi:hypothetical protein